MTNPTDPNARTRHINCSALRTLHALERLLRRHIDELAALDCEDIEAAEAIVFAIEATERSLQNVGVVRRRLNEA